MRRSDDAVEMLVMDASEGIDIEILKHNMELSDDEKILRHNRNAEAMLELWRAAEAAGYQTPLRRSS